MTKWYFRVERTREEQRIFKASELLKSLQVLCMNFNVLDVFFVMFK